MNITAVFTQDEYAISKDIIGQGAITLRPEKGKYYYGDAVEIEASAVDGWRFSHWEGDIDPDKTSWNPVTIVVRDNIDLLAVFKREEFIVSIGEKGSGSVSIQPQKDAYHYGDQITITATPHRLGLSAIGRRYSNYVQSLKLDSYRQPVANSSLYTKRVFFKC